MQEELRFLSTIPIDWLVKLLIAALCGTIVGIEREWRRKAAGLRTNAMICMGSCLYILAADLILAQHPELTGDPTRMAGQVVVGMGFIGAGAIIFQGRGPITGLTSAAAMWVVAAVGVVIGVGFPLFGLMVTLLVVGILGIVGKFGYYILGKCVHHTIRLSFEDRPETWQQLEHACIVHSKKIESFPVKHEILHDTDICFVDVRFCDVHPDHHEFLLDLLKIKDVRPASRRQASPEAM